jgi:hypothetical protein
MWVSARESGEAKFAGSKEFEVEVIRFAKRHAACGQIYANASLHSSGFAACGRIVRW